MAYRIVVTEVTIYNRSRRCVAGFDIDRQVMVRPEPAPGEFWEAICCGTGTTFHPGHQVEFDGRPAGTQPPHGTEDVVVVGNPIRRFRLPTDRFRELLAASLQRSVAAVFGDHLIIERSKAYVPAQAPCGSLAAVELTASQVGLHEDAFQGKRSLRASVRVAGSRLNLSVGAKDLKQAYSNGGLEAARERIAESRRLHVRLGLARPFDDIPDRCYLQVNGIYPI